MFSECTVNSNIGSFDNSCKCDLIKTSMTMEFRYLVKHINNELELQSDTVDYVMNQVSHVEFVAVLCVLGGPSSAKTGILNAILKYWRRVYKMAECSRAFVEIIQPKNSKDDEQRIDGILVSIPPILGCDRLGKKTAIILLDVWNNFAESEDVYGKLLEFCFQISSVKLFSFFDPLRQVAWWNGSFEASTNFSPELKSMYSLLKTTSSHKKYRARSRNSGSSSSVIAVRTNSEDESEYFPVEIQKDEVAFMGPKEIVPSIMNRICKRGSGDCAFKRSELKNRLGKFLTSISSTASAVSQPHGGEEIVVSIENPAGTQQILQAYKKRLLQVYSESSQMFLASQELNECSVRFVHEFGNDLEEVLTTCEPHFQQLRRFHNESSVNLIEIEIVKNLREVLRLYENLFIFNFKKQLEEYRIREDREDIESNFSATVETTVVKVLAAFHSSQSPLQDEVEILTAKLKDTIRSKILKDLDRIQNEMEHTVQTFKVFKNKLDGRMQSSVCVSEGDFEEAVEYAWKAMEASAREFVIQSTFIRVRDELAQEYEDKLRQQNRQILKSEICLAKQATSIAAHYVLKLLKEYLNEFGVVTGTEVSRAFQVATELAEQAFLSTPGYNDSPAWQEAFHSLQSTLKDLYHQVRQTNLNAIRRWDRALTSAHQSCAEFYHKQMDQLLPEYKISLKELESIHEACATETVSGFTVSSEVNEPTEKHYKQVFLKTALEIWKEGYVWLIEKNKGAEEPKMTNDHANRYPGGTQQTLHSEVPKKARISEDRSNMTVTETSAAVEAKKQEETEAQKTEDRLFRA